MKPPLGILNSSLHRQHPRYRGCKVHYIFNEFSNFEGYDSTGYRNGTAIGYFSPNNMVWAVGPDGPIGSFVQANQAYIQASFYYTYLTTQVEGTILAKVYRRTAPAAAPIFEINYFSASEEFICEWGGTGDTLHVSFTGNGVLKYEYTTTGTFPISQWHSLAIVGGPKGNALYMNGKKQALTYTTGSASNVEWFSSFNISNGPNLNMGGIKALTPQRFLDGYIDYFKVYDRPLTESEIWSHHTDPYLEFASVLKDKSLAGVTLAAPHRRMLGIGG